jgi:F0F1-type ATP synthase assembly protein I
MATLIQFCLNLSIALVSVLVLGMTLGAFIAKYSIMNPVERLMCWLVFVICGMNISIYFSILITEYSH